MTNTLAYTAERQQMKMMDGQKQQTTRAMVMQHAQVWLGFSLSYNILHVVHT